MLDMTCLTIVASFRPKPKGPAARLGAPPDPSTASEIGCPCWQTMPHCRRWGHEPAAAALDVGEQKAEVSGPGGMAELRAGGTAERSSAGPGSRRVPQADPLARHVRGRFTRAIRFSFSSPDDPSGNGRVIFRTVRNPEPMANLRAATPEDPQLGRSSGVDPVLPRLRRPAAFRSMSGSTGKPTERHSSCSRPAQSAITAALPGRTSSRPMAVRTAAGRPTPH